MRDQDEAFIERVSEALRAPVPVSPGFDARVMAAVRAARPDAAAGDVADGADVESPRRGLRWLTGTRTVRFRPVAALALAAALGLTMNVDDDAFGEERVEIVMGGDTYRVGD